MWKKKKRHDVAKHLFARSYSHLIVSAVFEGEIARDGGHGFGEAETRVRHLVRYDVGAVEGKVDLPPAAHVPMCTLQLHV